MVEGRVRQFTMLLQDYRTSPQFMMERLWAAAAASVPVWLTAYAKKAIPSST